MSLDCEASEAEVSGSVSSVTSGGDQVGRTDSPRRTSRSKRTSETSLSEGNSRVVSLDVVVCCHLSCFLKSPGVVGRGGFCRKCRGCHKVRRFGSGN